MARSQVNMQLVSADAIDEIVVPSVKSRAPANYWVETLLLMLAGGLLMLLMTQPAFGSSFFGDDFLYIGQLRKYGNDYLRAIFSPTDNIFFRPVFGAGSLFWHAVLPLDPWIYHVRNFAVSLVNLVILHRILLYLVASRRARVLAVLFFAVSKIHLTAIGYINVYDTITSGLLLLATILAFLRYRASRRWWDYALALVFCFLSISCKDYGLVTVGVVVALAVGLDCSPDRWRPALRWWLRRLAPLPLMVLVYLGVRYAIVGPLPEGNPAYSPQLSLDLTIRKVVIFTSTLGNLSLADGGTTGASGLGSALAPILVPLGVRASWLDVVLYLPLLVLMGGVLLAGWRRAWPLLFPLGWIAAYFGPTLLTRNIQMYYMYEALAGAVVLLGMALDRAGLRWRTAWSMALPLIVVLGACSNYASLYHWQFAANGAGRVIKPILQAHRGQELEAITFVTDSRPFWEYTLTGDQKGPVIPELLGQPAVRIQFLDYANLPAGLADASPSHPFYDLDNSSGPMPVDGLRPPLVLDLLSPATTVVGTPFSVQPNGQSAIGITAEHATSGTVVVFDDVRLVTAFADPTYLTALVPTELLMSPGRHEVYLTNGLSESNRLPFNVSQEPLGDAPLPVQTPSASEADRLSAASPDGRAVARLVQLVPPTTRLGQRFAVQPDGESALSVVAENARPGTTIVFGGQPLSTVYGNEQWLTAIVPAALFRTAGQYEVFLRQGATESNRLIFTVEP